MSVDKITQAELIARESGPGVPPNPPPGELPPGLAQWAVPHYLSKIGLINQVARAYRWTYDEALRHSRVNAIAMLRDTEIRDALNTRWIPTVQLAWHLEPRDPTDPNQLDAVKKLESVIRETPRLQDLFKSLLWATWFGRSGVALLWEWDYSHPDGERRLVVRKHKPINGDSLVARWSDDWGILVNGLWQGDKEPTDRGYAHFFTPREMEAVIVHMHDPEDCDYYEPEMAGQIRGSGLRGHIYWYWWIANNFMALAEDYAERFANGLWKAYYEESNPQAKTELEASLAQYKNSSVLFLPRKATMQAVNDVVVEQVNTANPQFILELVQYLRDKIRRYITGSNIADETDVSIGGDAIGVDEDRVSRVVKYDAVRLAETLSEQWLPILTKYNCGENIPPPFFVFDIESPNAGDVLNFAKVLRDLGSSIDLDHLHKITGVPMGSPGDNVSTKLQNFQPVAVDQQPQGVPSTGSPGPQDQQTAPSPSPDTQQQQFAVQPQQEVQQPVQ